MDTLKTSTAGPTVVQVL